MFAAPRVSALSAWALCLFTCVCVATYFALYQFGGPGVFGEVSIEGGFPLLHLGVVLGGIVGAVVIARHPRHRIGWLLAFGQAATGLGLAADAYAYRVLVEHELGSPASGRFAVWVSFLFSGSFALAVLSAVFLLVPDGRLLSRRWRPVMAVLIGSQVLWIAVFVVAVRLPGGDLSDAALSPTTRVLIEIVWNVTLSLVLASVIVLVLRLRRSTGVQRQQLRWIMASPVLLVLGMATLVVYEATGDQGQPWYAIILLYVGYASVPICCGIAILRYRLYDIDVIINRAVVLAILATFATLGYVAVVVTIGAALGAQVRQQFWPSLVALIVVALAFQPLRQQVLRFADRLVYGRRAAPYEALAEFSRRLGRSRAPSDLLPPLAEAVARSVGAQQSTVTLKVPGTAGLSAVWPGAPATVPDVEFEVRDRDEPLGCIAVVMPPGRALRPAERRLLEDLSAQAGLAFRNLRLDAELRMRVAQLAGQSVDLVASRRRLLAARDDERRRIAGVIEREVLRHLRPIPAAIESLDPTATAAADRTLAELDAATRAALEALREVTSGLFPLALTRRGLVAALQGRFARLGRPDVVSVDPRLDRCRFPDRIEAAAFFCAVALMGQPDAPAQMRLTVEDGCLVLDATGRAHNGARRHDDRSAIADRVAAVGGRVSGGRGPDGRFTLRVEFPLAGDPVQGGETRVHTAASRSVPNADLAT